MIRIIPKNGSGPWVTLYNYSGAMLELVSAGGERSRARKRAEKRIGYIGGHGGGNLGDDVMYEAVSQLLPDAGILSFALPRQEKMLRRLGLGGPQFFQAAILGGGTLINPSWARQVSKALDQGLPMWTLGTGAGSCGFEQPDDVDVSMWRDLLNRFQRVGVRGPRTRATLLEMGVREVEITGDLALALTPEICPPRAQTRRFAINLTLAPGEAYDPVLYPALLELESAAKALLQKDWELLPIVMSHEDFPAMRAFMQRIGMPDAALPLLRSSAEFFASIGTCAFTLAVRLHVAILSCCAGVPPLLLGYRDKCLDFMESMQLGEWHVPLQDAAPGEVWAKVQALSETAPALHPIVHGRALAWRRTLEKYAVHLHA